MNEREELPNWTGSPQERAADAPRPVAPAPKRGRAALGALLGLAVLIGMGAIGYFFAQRQADDTTATNGDVAAPSVEQDGEQDGDDSASTADDEAIASSSDALTVDVDESGEQSETADGDSAESGDAADGDTTDSDSTDADASAADSTRTAVFRSGKLYLGGKVPSQEVADVIAAKAFAVVGPDNVVVEYEIDPSVVIDPGESTPLYVEDVVLFGFNSVTIEAPFVPLLDLGTLLLSQNPQATLTVVTRTDAVGSAEVNLDVARKRADAVITYWVGKGVNPDQLIADPKGEEGASEDDDEQTAALQRRAEFVITGLLD